MASILSPKLQIQENLPSKRVKVTVTCKISFSKYEANQLSKGLVFRLDCKVMGEDFASADDHLFSFASKYFPDGSIATLENVSFTADIPANWLNEDDSIFSGYEDDIYARLTLKDLYTGRTTSRKTNLIQHRF